VPLYTHRTSLTLPRVSVLGQRVPDGAAHAHSRIPRSHWSTLITGLRVSLIALRRVFLKRQIKEPKLYIHFFSLLESHRLTLLAIDLSTVAEQRRDTIASFMRWDAIFISELLKLGSCCHPIGNIIIRQCDAICIP